MKKVLSNYRILWVIIMGLVVVIVIGGVRWWRDHNSSGVIFIKRKRADILQVANDLYSNREYEKASEKFDLLVRLQDTDPYIVSRAIYRLGFCEYYLKHYENARSWFKTYLNRYENENYENENISAYDWFRTAKLFIAQTYIKQENMDYERAYLGFDKLAVDGIVSSIQEEAMYYAAYSLKGLKAYDEALGRYTEFLTQFPHSKFILNAYFDKGTIYANKKDYGLALTNYKFALTCTDSQDGQDRKPEIQLQIGNTYYNQLDFERAFKVYNELLETYPNSEQAPYARRVIADIHKKKEQWDKAIEEYKRIGNYKEDEKIGSIYILGDDGFLRSVDLMPLSYYEIGKISAEKKDFEEAFKWYAKIIKDYRTDPIVPSALYNAMKALNALRDSGELEREVQSELCEILEKNPEDIRKLKIREVLEHFAFHPLLSKDKAKLQNTLLAVETQLKFADIKREELEDYTGAATEYAKLVNYPQMPHPRVDLLKLQGKYYEAHCHEKESASDKSVGAYQEVIRLFEATFLPLIDTPNIDMPHLTEAQFGYCIQTARYYVGNAYFATNQFDKAIAAFEKFLKKVDIKNEKVKEQVKTAHDKIEKARRSLRTKTGRLKSSPNASGNLDSSEKPRSAENLIPFSIEYFSYLTTCASSASRLSL